MSKKATSGPSKGPQKAKSKPRLDEDALRQVAGGRGKGSAQPEVVRSKPGDNKAGTA